MKVFLIALLCLIMGIILFLGLPITIFIIAIKRNKKTKIKEIKSLYGNKEQVCPYCKSTLKNGLCENCGAKLK